MHVIGGDAPLRCRLTIREAMAYPVELPLEASVQHRAAASTSTASSSTAWRAPRACASFTDSVRRSSWVSGTAVRNARAHPPKVLVHQLPVLLGDRLEMVRAAARSHKGQEVAAELREARSLSNLRHHRPPRRRLTPRPGEEVAQFRIARECRRGIVELAADELGLIALLREREERLRVRRGRPPWLHRLSPRARKVSA